MTNTDSPGTEWPRYFHGQLLTAQDLADEQDCFREKLRRHNRLLHGWGVVCGLHVTPTGGGGAVSVSPGYALDPCGDEILVEQRVILKLPTLEHAKDSANNAACPDGAWIVAVRYAEIPTQFVPVIGEDDTPQPSHIRETYELRVLATLPADYEPGRVSRRGGAASACPPCPPDPEERWVALAEVRIQEGQVTVGNAGRTRPLRAPRATVSSARIDGSA